METLELLEHSRLMVSQLSSKIKELESKNVQQATQIVQLAKTVNLVVGEFMGTLGDLLMSIQEQPQAGVPTRQEAMDKAKEVMQKYVEMYKASHNKQLIIPS